ncbi:MAG: hypothetical protein ACOYJY_05590 [Acutalibacteraceae bacterium]|jgi:hypothetical protein
MADKTYEEKREEIVRQGNRQWRKAFLLMLGGILLIAGAFAVGVILKAEWVGFFAAGALILVGFVARIGGEAMKNARQFQHHQLELLDESAPSGRFKI